MEQSAKLQDPADKTEEELPTLHKVAILMVALGQDASGEVLKFLSDREIEEITQAIAALKNVTPELMDRVLEDFEQHMLAGKWITQGGADFARDVLERAVGPRKAQEILDRVNTRQTSGFYVLKNVSPQQIAPFISHEHPQTIALILSQLDPEQAAGILAHLPERMQAEVAYRIATMENITPNVLKQIEESLEANLRDILGGNQDVGGPKVVADILNLTGTSVEKNVLDIMDGTDPEIAEEELKDTILGNMSERVRTFITEETEFLAPMRLSEVEEVQLRIVQQCRQLEDQGQIVITRGDANEQFV